MSFLERIGITSRLATAEETAQIEALRSAESSADLVPQTETPAKTSLLKKWGGKLFKKEPAQESQAPAPASDDVLELTRSPSLLDRAIEAGASAQQKASNRLSGFFSRARQNVETLPSRVAAVGRSLKDPAVIKHAAAELAISAGTMTLARTAAAATLATAGIGAAGAFAGVTATTAVVGGLLKSRRQYHAAIEADERSIKGYWSHVLNNKKQLAKNMAGSAVIGALGAGIGALVGDWIHSADTPAPVDVKDAHEAVQNAAPVPVTPEVPVYQAPPELDEAIKIVREHRFLSEETLKLAQQGDSTAIKEIAHAINTDGIRADDHLVKPLLAEAARQAEIISAPKPDIVYIPPAPELAAAVPETNLAENAASTVSADTVKDVAIVAGGTAAATAAAVAGVNALPAVALYTAQPKYDNAPARTVQVCQMRDIENSDQIGLRCPETPAFAQIRQGDMLRVQYTDRVKNITAIEDVRNPAAAMPTKEYEAIMANDSTFLGGLRAKLKGYVSDKFNRAAAVDVAAPIAANENGAATSVAVNDNPVAAVTAPSEELPPIAETEASTVTSAQSFKEIFAQWTTQQMPAAPIDAPKVTTTFSSAFGGKLFSSPEPVNDEVLAQTGQMAAPAAAGPR